MKKEIYELRDAMRENESALRRIEQHLIEQSELSQLGHRVVYDTKTGCSTNMCGAWVDPSLLDANGYQVKFRG